VPDQCSLQLNTLKSEGRLSVTKAVKYWTLYEFTETCKLLFGLGGVTPIAGGVVEFSVASAPGVRFLPQLSLGILAAAFY
jgi:hypothetical protein